VIRPAPSNSRQTLISAHGWRSLVLPVGSGERNSGPVRGAPWGTQSGRPALQHPDVLTQEIAAAGPALRLADEYGAGLAEVIAGVQQLKDLALSESSVASSSASSSGIG
jgi:hypothetical protein